MLQVSTTVYLVSLVRLASEIAWLVWVGEGERQSITKISYRRLACCSLRYFPRAMRYAQPFLFSIMAEMLGRACKRKFQHVPSQTSYRIASSRKYLTVRPDLYYRERVSTPIYDSHGCVLRPQWGRCGVSGCRRLHTTSVAVQYILFIFVTSRPYNCSFRKTNVERQNIGGLGKHVEDLPPSALAPSRVDNVVALDRSNVPSPLPLFQLPSRFTLPQTHGSPVSLDGHSTRFALHLWSTGPV